MNIVAYFTNTGTPATGLSPTIRIRNVATGALVVTDAAMTEIGDGWYKYDFTTYDPTLDYAIRCDGTAALTAPDRYVFAGNDSFRTDIRDAILSDSTAFPGANVDASIAANAVLINALNNISTGDVLAQCTSALNTYDGPTNAEMNARTLLAASYATAAGQSTIDGNVLANAVLINALNDISTGDVLAQCSSALNTYDGPTNAEMVARTLLAANYATDANQTTINNNVLANAALVNGLNDISTADVLAQCSSALLSYDGPTNAEMTARTLLASEYATAANQTTVLANQGTIQKSVECDVGVDTTATPWQAVYYQRGTAVELYRKNLTQADGTNVVSVNDLIGNYLE